MEAWRIDAHQVLEGEHLLPDADAQFGVAFFQSDEQGLAEVPVQGIEEFGGHLQSAGLVQSAGVFVADFVVEHVDHSFDDFDGRWRQGGKPLDHLFAHFGADVGVPATVLVSCSLTARNFTAIRPSGFPPGHPGDFPQINFRSSPTYPCANSFRKMDAGISAGAEMKTVVNEN